MAASAVLGKLFYMEALMLYYQPYNTIYQESS